MNSSLYVIAVVLCGLSSVWCKEGVSYRFQRTQCNKFNKKFLYNVTCRIRHINRTSQMLNWEGYIQPNVTLTDIRVKVMTYIKYTTVYRPSLVHFSESVCDILNIGKSHYLHVMKEVYLKHSNMLEPCPKQGRLYIKDMIYDTSKFPQFIPAGEYRLDLEFVTSMNGVEEFIILSQDFGEVKPLGALQF